MKSTAILFFSLDARVESTRKKLVSGSRTKNNLLISLLVKHTQKVLNHSEIDVFHFNQKNQRGQTFGEKLSNAFADIFALGYENVISVGNDTPDISLINWQHCVQLLHKNKCIIGPTSKQGTYLIGLQRDAFRAAEFQNLPWQTPALLPDLLQHYLSGEVIELLPQLHEFNSSGDVISYLHHSSGKSRTFLRVLNSLIFDKKIIFTALKTVASVFHANTIRRRGPPEFWKLESTRN